MRWFRALILCCCLLVLLPGSAHAARPSQSIGCDAASLVSQYPPVLELLNYLFMPYARRQEVTIDGQSLTLQICAPQNQSVTADRLLDRLVEALPRLSSAAGVPLGGGAKRPILIVADQELPPWVNGQLDENGIIRVRNASPERTIIHEGAHYWASEQNFADTWMIEGYADYLTEQVTGQPRMVNMPETTCAGVTLMNWDYEPPQTALCGYVRGAAVFRELAATLGPEQLRTMLGDLRAQSAPMHSWTLLVGLERISERDLTPVFLRYEVFPPEYDLQRRAQQWGDLRRLRGLADLLGVALPPQIASDIDARDYDAADRWLSRLSPLLDHASAVAQSCQALALACDRPWQPLPQDDPAALDPISARLAAARPLFDQLAALRTDARALGLAPPVQLEQAVAALDTTVAEPLRQARAALERGRVFEQQCHDLAAPCLSGWRDQWRGGNIALAVDEIAKQTAVLSQSTQVEQRCDAALDACRAIWHPYLRAGQFIEAGAALGELAMLLDKAASIEQRCGDMAKNCRASWQAALRSEQLPGLERRLGDVDRMLMRVQDLDNICAGWNCAQAWRAVFRTNSDPRAVLRFLDEARSALPTLRQAATGRTSQADRSPIWPLAGSATPTLIEQAHQVFEQGDVARARALADQSLAAASTPHQDWQAIGITLAVALLLGVFVVAIRRKPPRARRAVADQALLSELLSQPPGAKKQRTTNVKKAA